MRAIYVVAWSFSSIPNTEFAFWQALHSIHVFLLKKQAVRDCSCDVGAGWELIYYLTQGNGA